MEISPPPTAPDFLVHREGDQVGVAVRDVPAGRGRAVYMDSDREVALEVGEPIPLGHKVALADIAAGQDLIEYGVRVAVAREAIARGRLVHVHNVRSARWQRSA